MDPERWAERQFKPYRQRGDQPADTESQKCGWAIADIKSGKVEAAAVAYRSKRQDAVK